MSDGQLLRSGAPVVAMGELLGPGRGGVYGSAAELVAALIPEYGGGHVGEFELGDEELGRLLQRYSYLETIVRRLRAKGKLVAILQNPDQVREVMGAAGRHRIALYGSDDLLVLSLQNLGGGLLSVIAMEASND